ncbi:MAG: hypothetical protein ACLQUW_00910 [Desulfobaccales bacterium]
MAAKDWVKWSILVKAVIFGFCYFSILIFYQVLGLWLAMDPPDTGTLAGKVILYLLDGLGLLLNLPFLVLFPKYPGLGWFFLILNVLVWGLAFYAILLLREWRRKPDSGKG